MEYFTETDCSVTVIAVIFISGNSQTKESSFHPPLACLDKFHWKVRCWEERQTFYLSARDEQKAN